MSLPLQDPTLLKTRAYIDGQWVDADDGATFTVSNPVNGESIAEVARVGADETRRAIEAAERAMSEWKSMPAKARAQLLRRWFDLMMTNQEDLAIIMTAEQGKVLAESRGEVAYGAAFVEWFGEEAKRVYGETIPGHMTDKRIKVLRQPIGVAGCISPWNLPLYLFTWKIAPALAAGNAVVKFQLRL